MKRSQPLRSDPEKIRAWQQRAEPMKRTRMRASKQAATKRVAHRDRMGELRPVVFARDNYRCVRCGRRDPELYRAGLRLEAHHRLMRSQGGPDTLANLVSLCGPNPEGCHGWAHQRPAEAYAAGLLIRSWEGPPEVAWGQESV